MKSIDHSALDTMTNKQRSLVIKQIRAKYEELKHEFHNDSEDPLITDKLAGFAYALQALGDEDFELT